MNSDRQRIAEDLRGRVAGDVLCDAMHTQLYASDASLYEIRPMAVVRPRVTADVAATVRYAQEAELPVHARGAGSGLAGGALGPGIVIDFSRYMHRIVEIGDECVRVQAGVVLGDLNRALARLGRTFGPDPAMTQVTTIGGVLAVDASGSRWPWAGSARRHTLGMKVVLADGEVLKLDSPGQALSESTNQRGDKLRAAVEHLAARRRNTIQQHASATLVNSSGYGLDRAIEGLAADEDEAAPLTVDLPKLLVGSEGTLALTTEATLRTMPLPAERGATLLVFDSLDKAARCVEVLGEGGDEYTPSACDLMDRRHLSLARETDVRYELLIPAAAEAVLMVEHSADTQDDLRDKLNRTVRLARDDSGLAAGALVTEADDELRLYWNLASGFVPTLHGVKGVRRAAPGIEDMAVPPAALPVFLRHMQDTLKQHGVTASFFGHAWQGQLHVRPLLDLSDAEEVRRLERLAADLYEKVWLLGGTISGEHGDGLSRTQFVARQHGPLLNVFREVKQIFDPAQLLNPGKIIPVAPQRMSRNLRRLTRPVNQLVAEHRNANLTQRAKSGESEVVELQLAWDQREALQAAAACNGCGACRTQAEGTRMCPIFRFTPREEASPRAKANLVRAVLTGQLPADTLLTSESRSVADLCVHCHMCRLECPANVDIPRMMIEAKAAHTRTNGLPPGTWWLSHIDSVSRLASRTPRLANWMLRNPTARWVLEKTLGLAQGRVLPRLETRPFMQQATGRQWREMDHDEPDRVLYFVDTFANYYDAQLAEAFVRLLRHNRVGVAIPPGQQHSAMPLIAQGALDKARRVAARNVELLAEGVRRGYQVVGTEPSAVLALTHEYPMLLDNDEDARLVAEHTREATHYLWGLHQRGRLKLDFAPLDLKVAHHTPCHMKALGVGEPGVNLMRLIPRLRLTPIEKGCSGMAGMYGMQKANYRSSLRAGLPLLSELRRGDYDLGATECSTCRIQMEQSAPQPTLHPVKLLAMSYGLISGESAAGLPPADANAKLSEMQ